MKNLQAKFMVMYAAVKNEDGASMVEYALLVVLIALIALAAVNAAGTEVSNTFQDITSGLKTTN